jgi:hypothetical protein
MKIYDCCFRKTFSYRNNKFKKRTPEAIKNADF